ncbi:MAG TPA: SulP family inorganic anion transporter [Flavobacterium sp.]|nr:SulP family inorganic anion transporter [Flavobacterium sp.]
MWLKKIKNLKLIKGYSSKTLKSDSVAGITLAAYGIPVSMGYASLAGLPAQFGIYGYLIGGFFYAIFGSSKQLAIGPTSAISLLIGTTIASMANGDVQRWYEIASLTALVFGVLAIISYFLKLSGIVNFISESVLVGFKAGAALTIGLTQLPKLLGIKDGGNSFFDRIYFLFNQLSDINITVFLFGISAIILLLIGEKLFPGKPIAIFIVILSIVILSTPSIGLESFKIVGEIPTGLPQFQLPSLRAKDIDGVIPLAFACFLLSFIESISAARSIAQKNGYTINPQQELLAIGLANTAVAFGQGYPVAGGLSQTAVNDNAGAKTRLSLVIASITIALCLIFLTKFLQNLPLVILAAIVLVAIRNLFDFRELVHLYKIDKKEFFVAIIALLGVIFLGILKGVMLAAIITLLLILKEASNPYIASLGRIPGTTRYSDIQRHPDNELIPNILIIRIEASIIYFNVEKIKETILSKINSEKQPIHTLLIDMSSSPRIDIAGARFIKQLVLDLKSKKITLKIAEARAEVRDTLRIEKLETILGTINRFDTVNDVVESSIKKSDFNIKK